MARTFPPQWYAAQAARRKSNQKTSTPRELMVNTRVGGTSYKDRKHSMSQWTTLNKDSQGKYSAVVRKGNYYKEGVSNFKKHESVSSEVVGRFLRMARKTKERGVLIGFRKGGRGIPRQFERSASQKKWR